MFHEEHRLFFSLDTNTYLPKYISNTEISAGVTPGILDACEIVLGLCFVSLCLDSVEIDFKLE